MSQALIWHKVLANPEELPEGLVRTVHAGTKDICLTHYEGKFCALDNKCPHQGGPLGEGSIENGLLRCPWHGWDYHPCTGKVPEYDDGVATYPVEERADGIYVGLEPEPAHVQTISDVMVQTMINWGIDTVFGMVGHSNLGFADAMKRAEASGQLTYIGIRHEGAASFAASAHAKLTGRPAGCFAIAGPGATNMYTGMWDAKVDRAPLLALTGQVDTQVVGTGNFQELDLVSAFSSVAAFNQRVLPGSKHAELMTLAVKHALLRRDVSHLTFPNDTQPLPLPDGVPQTPDQRIPSLKVSPPKESFDQAVQMIQQARRPIIVVGHGARFHMDQITKMAEAIPAPILTTFKGKGLIADTHPLGCGVLGRSGTPIASWFMNEADLILAIGSSFSKHTGITPKIPTIQIDFDPLALAKFHKIDCPLLGEISATTELLVEAVKDRTQAVDPRQEIANRWKIWREEKKRRLALDRGKGINSAAVFDALTRLAPSHAVMTVDVGNNAYSFGRYFESAHHSFIMSGYLGSIGFALPVALGAWAANKGERPVIAVAGDGGFGQYMAELTTSVKYQMNIKVILLNNFELGKISKEQHADNFEVWQTSLVNPSFADYATNCGAFGLRVDKKEDLTTAMAQVLDHRGTALLEVMADGKLI
ncbi:MAG: thiamine pyrophosphate-binding protein [Bacteroidota bacterium]